jgi:3-hydroxyisobutyrate dehydrogenase
MKKIAWIGTGVMGKPMLEHLLQGGYQIKAFNRTVEKVKAMEPFVTACDSIEECIKDAEVVFSIVGYPKDVADVYEEVFKYVDKGTYLVDMTTSSPTLAKVLHTKAESLGLHMLDAPVTGGDIGAINGTLSIMVGGNEADYEVILPMLQLMGKRITYMGEAGSGQHAKLANQIVIAGNVAAIAEAMIYAKDKGLDQEAMLSVIMGGSAASWQADKNGSKMIKKDYAPGFYIKHFLKDLKLINSEKGSLPLIVVERVRKIYQNLSDQGLYDLGTQAIIEYYLRQLAQ